ncbi:MAG: lipid A biosynthesis acyltransferase [Burkholderiaceae bacterium]|nr:lipid A biosynthesis acyltransferase [Burkholderiaceae bacterium]
MTHIATWIGLWCCRWIAFGPRFLRTGVIWILACLAFWLSPGRRHIAMTNLRLCFPQWSELRRHQIVKQHFECYARAFIERFAVWFGSPQKIRQMVALNGLEHLRAAEGQPVIVLAPHFLGLDAGGLRFQLECRFVSMYSNQSNPLLNEWTLRGRTRFNDPVIVPRQQGILTVVRWLKRGLPLYFLPDMDFGPRDAVFASFFGLPAATVTSVVRLSRSLNAVVVPLVTEMTADGYVATFYPGWQHPDDDAVETIAQGVEKMNRFIEARILERPEQYLWTHRRFKTRPPGDPPVYG